MNQGRGLGLAGSLLWLLGTVAACDNDEQACPSECPVTGRAVTEGDIRLVLDAENSYVVIEDESETVDGAIIAGELVLRPETAGCIGTPKHPCHATIQRLTVTITDLRVGDLSFSEPTLSIDAPLEVTDTGNGFSLESAGEVHTCTVQGGSQQHQVGAPTVAANILFDDDTRPDWSLGGPWATLYAWWPLVLAFPINACMTRSLPLFVYASFMGE